MRERITQLRLQKGVSEYKMSYDLGHSRGYINNISSGKVLPSMAEFFAICDYFDLSPAEFFNERMQSPVLARETIREMEQLEPEDLKLVEQLIRRMLGEEERKGDCKKKGTAAK